MPSWLVALLLACALLSSLVVAGAGSDPKVPAAPEGSYTLDAAEVLPNVVTLKDVLATAEDSPARTVLAAFQAVQFRDPLILRGLMSPTARDATSRTQVAAAVRTVGSALGRPVPMGTRVKGDTAVVRIVVLAYLGRNRRPVHGSTHTIRLSRVARRWLLDDIDFVLEPAAELRAVRRGQ